jgi:hypothetical protein
MQSLVAVDGKKLFLNPFMSALIGNILDAVVKSLKTPPGNAIEFILGKDELRLTIDGLDIPLNKGQAQQIVGKRLKRNSGKSERG